MVGTLERYFHRAESSAGKHKSTSRRQTAGKDHIMSRICYSGVRTIQNNEGRSQEETGGLDRVI